MKKLKFINLFYILAFICFVSLGCSQSVNAKNLDLKIVFTNDIHGKIVGDEDIETGKFIGYSKIGSYISQTKHDNKNTLIIDAGDAFHGDTVANLSQGQAVLSIMNEIGYNYFLPGNHDFNFGKERLLKLTHDGSFKTICSNLLNKSVPMFEENDIFEIDGVKIGIFALTSPELITKSNLKNIEEIEVIPPIEVAKKQVETLKEKGADFIILISHLGILSEEESWWSYAVRDSVPEIDLIIDSHSHNVLDDFEQLDGKAVITSAGISGQNVGVVDIEIKDKIKKIKPYNLSFSDFKDIPKNKKIEKIIKSETDKIKPVLEQNIGYTSVYLNGERETIRTEKTNLAKIVGEAVLKETDADIAFLNAGAFRSSIEVGNIKMADVLRVFSLGHSIVTKSVSGENIIKALELALRQYPKMSALFPQVAGMTFEITATEGNNKVKDVTINGSRIDLKKEYIFATNDFLASGGDGFDMIKSSRELKQFDSLDKIFAKYVSEISPIDLDSNLKKSA